MRSPAAPVSVRHRWRPAVVLPRLPGLVAGLVLFGVGVAVMAESGLGLGPWEALHQGLARLSGMEMGTVSILLGIPILLAWWPLGERPGAGTLLNVALIGTSTNAALALLPTPAELAGQAVALGGGLALIAMGSALYLSANLGPGPRDGLMTGLHHRFGWSIRRSRTVVELAVLGLGFLAGGTIGVGTVAFALGIGPLIQAALAIVDREGRVSRRRRVALERGEEVGE